MTVQCKPKKSHFPSLVMSELLSLSPSDRSNNHFLPLSCMHHSDLSSPSRGQGAGPRFSTRNVLGMRAFLDVIRNFARPTVTCILTSFWIVRVLFSPFWCFAIKYYFLYRYEPSPLGKDETFKAILSSSITLPLSRVSGGCLLRKWIASPSSGNFSFRSLKNVPVSTRTTLWSDWKWKYRIPKAVWWWYFVWNQLFFFLFIIDFGPVER